MPRELVPDRNDDELHYVEDARGPLAFNDNDTLECRE